MAVKFEPATHGSADLLADRASSSATYSGRNSLHGTQPRGKTARELTIGRKLRELREDRQFTQQEMAAKAGVPRTYISRIENARLLPGPVMLQRIADALSVGILDLLPAGKNILGQPEEEPFWSALAEQFAQLLPGDMIKVLGRVRAWSEAANPLPAGDLAVTPEDQVAVAHSFVGRARLAHAALTAK